MCTLLPLNRPYGRTGDDIAEALDLLVFQVRARTSELRADKKIVDSGRRRMGISGRRAIVWVCWYLVLSHLLMRGDLLAA
ncbi:MAG: hypothetical protein R3D83_02110 [Caenibius sp.]